MHALNKWPMYGSTPHSQNSEAQGLGSRDESISFHYDCKQPPGDVFAFPPLNFVFNGSGVLGAQRNTSFREHRCGSFKLEVDRPARHLELCMLLNLKVERESTVPGGGD